MGLEGDIIVLDGFRSTGHARVGLALEMIPIGGATLETTALITAGIAALVAALISTALVAITILLVSATLAAAIISAAALVVTPAAQELKIGGNDLGGIMGLPVFFPASRLETPFNVNLAPLGQVFFTHFGLAPKDNNAMPFGFFLPIPGTFIGPLFTGGDGKVDNRNTRLGITNLRIPPQMSNQHHLI